MYLNIFFLFFVIFFLKSFFFFNIGYYIRSICSSKKSSLLFLLVGFCFFLLFSNFFYFFLNFRSSFIFYIFFLFSTILFLRNIFLEKIKFIFEFLKIFSLSIPYVLLFSFLGYFLGEQYYVFRGNQYDYFNYLSQAVLIKNHTFNYIIDNKDFINLEYPFKNMINLHMDIRPATGLLFGIFFFDELDIFLNAYIIKTYIFYLVLLSCYYFFESSFVFLNKIKIFFLSIIFSLSFWVIYIYEIDSIAHFYSIFLSILVYSLVLNFHKDEIEIKNNIIFFIIAFSSLFLIYPENFVIVFLSIAIFVIIKKCFFLSLLKDNYKLILLCIFFFVIFTIPNLDGTYLFIIKQAKVGMTNVNNFWGYFGAFVLGKESIVLYPEIVLNIKKLIINNNSFVNTLKTIQDLQFENKFILFYFNIIPSIFGFYHLTSTKILSQKDLLIFSPIIILNLIIFFKLIHNISLIYTSKYINLKYLLTSILIVTSLLSIALWANQAYWGLIKLFFYISFFVYLIILFEIFILKNSKSIYVQYFLILLLLLFPFYKFSSIKNKVETFDTMPSIMKKYLKTDISWSLPSYAIKECNGVKTKETDFFVLKYLGIKFNSHRIPFVTPEDYNSSFINKDYNCEIILKNGKFTLTNK